MKKIIGILAVSLMFSCVTSNQKKASRQIHRKLKKVDQLIAVHPNLAKYIETTVYDTIVVNVSKGEKTYIIEKDSVFIDSLFEVYKLLLIEKLELEDSISNGFNIESASQKDHQIYNQRIKDLQKKIDALKLSATNKTCKDQYFEYSDTLLDANIKIVDGKLEFKYDKKPQVIPVVYKYKTITVENKNNFLENPFLWILLLLFLAFVFYKTFSK